jgi:hypothetical protein
MVTEGGVALAGAVYSPEEVIVPVSDDPPTALSTNQTGEARGAPPAVAENWSDCPAAKIADEGAISGGTLTADDGLLELLLHPMARFVVKTIRANEKMLSFELRNPEPSELDETHTCPP